VTIQIFGKNTSLSAKEKNVMEQLRPPKDNGGGKIKGQLPLNQGVGGGEKAKSSRKEKKRFTHRNPND